MGRIITAWLRCNFCGATSHPLNSAEWKMPDGWVARQTHKDGRDVHACPECADRAFLPGELPFTDPT